MKSTAVSSVLARAPILATLTREDHEALAGALRRREIKNGQTLFSQDRPGDSLVILTGGLLHIQVKRQDGSQADLVDIYPGDVVGEMSCIDPAPRSATVTAAADSELFELDRTMWRSLKTNAPSVFVGVTGGIIDRVTQRLRETDERIARSIGVQPAEPDPGPPPPPECSTCAEAGGRINLKSLRTFRDYANEELRTLVKAAPTRAYRKGNLLCHEGAPGDSCFILACGTASVYKVVGGRQRFLAHLPTGAMVGQMALVDRAPRSASVKAEDDVVALELSRDAFDKLLAEHSPVALRLQQQIAVAGIRQLRMATGRLSELLPSVELPQASTSEVSRARITGSMRSPVEARAPSRPGGASPAPRRPTVPDRAATTRPQAPARPTQQDRDPFATPAAPRRREATRGPGHQGHQPTGRAATARGARARARGSAARSRQTPRRRHRRKGPR